MSIGTNWMPCQAVLVWLSHKVIIVERFFFTIWHKNQFDICFDSSKLDRVWHFSSLCDRRKHFDLIWIENFPFELSKNHGNVFKMILKLYKLESGDKINWNYKWLCNSERKYNLNHDARLGLYAFARELQVADFAPKEMPVRVNVKKSKEENKIFYWDWHWTRKCLYP